MTDQEQLDDAKRRYLAAKEDIDRLREKIALDNCPLKIGEHVKILDGNKTYEGIVDNIGPAPDVNEVLWPVVGAPTPWSASGKRINKTSGDAGKWSFTINERDELKNGVWHLADPPSLDEILKHI